VSVDRSPELAAVSAKLAEGYARIREVTDLDGASPARLKALSIAAAAAVRAQPELAARELTRAKALGVGHEEARGVGLVLPISRGEGVYDRYAAIVDEVYGQPRPRADGPPPQFPVDRQETLDYFVEIFGTVPGYVSLMADEAPRALEGYVLMRQWSLAENRLPPKDVELLLLTVNAAEYLGPSVTIHANGARRHGASEAEIVEAAICAIPAAGVACWLTAAKAIAE
jgi:4-carboxymuconolactone decarboxylase